MTEDGPKPAYTRSFWAKSRRDDPGDVHLLEHHLADVGACFEALLAQPTIRRRLAHTAGCDDLDDATVARLCVFAALHDIGKINTGFQTQIWSEADLQGHPKPRRAGHTSDLVPVLVGEDNGTSEWFLRALGWNELMGWDSDDGNTVCALFAATLAHHGEPLNLYDSKSANPVVWRPFAGLDPEQSVRKIRNLLGRWFPAAFTTGGQPLPAAPAFQHMFLGLCTLSDWIGSDEHWFKFVDTPDDNYMAAARDRAGRAIKQVGLDLAEQRCAFGVVPEFGALFDIPGSPQPHAIQRQAALETRLNEPVVIIESETGSGKTEAALWRFAMMYQEGLVDGLYFALPTRSAASQLHRRVNSFVSNLFPVGHKPEPVLAVPGYLQAGDFTGGRHMASYEVWWEHPDGHDARRKFWSAESAKRFLAAQIAVGTVDQAMMGALKVRHAHMRAACLARNLLVVDEVHSSDTYMRAIIKALLDAHTGAGGYALLMSATLGSAARRQFLFRGQRSAAPELPPPEEAEMAPYPAIVTSGPSGETVTGLPSTAGGKSVTVIADPIMHDFAGLAQRALSAARKGAKVLVVRNTVNFAIESHRALEEAANDADRGLLFACRDFPTLHHGRFSAEDRKLLDTALEEQFGRERDEGGRVVVGTQTLEQSLDLDADLLITDLCPMDVLLQRIGRLHRHHRPGERPAGFESAACVALTPEGEDLSPFLKPGPNRNGLGPGGYVYEDLRVLEATRRLVVQFSESREPWNIPEMNRMLVERATHPHALQSLVDQMGADWLVHHNQVEGVTIAEGLTASNAIICWECSFLDRGVVFGSVEERIRTRLGDEGVTVTFEPPPVSPFDAGLPIPQLAIPYHLSQGLTSEGPVAATTTDYGFEFAVQNARFRYDRLGLRRV